MKKILGLVVDYTFTRIIYTLKDEIKDEDLFHRLENYLFKEEEELIENLVEILKEVGGKKDEDSPDGF